MKNPIYFQVENHNYHKAYLKYGRICHLFPPVANRLIVSLLDLTESWCGCA